MTETAKVLLPPGVRYDRPGQERGMVVNDTGLPDDVVLDKLEEHASMLGLSAGAQMSAMSSRAQGNLLARRQFQPPTNPIEEIILARQLAERDDDVGSALDAEIAVALSDSFRHQHEDEVTVAVFDEISRKARINRVFAEMLREWLITSSVCTATVWTREPLRFQPQGADRQRTRTVVTPRVGVIPAEQVRVIGNDIFGNAPLAYVPATATEQEWLREFFDDKTTAARKAEMRARNPYLATILTGMVPRKDDMLYDWDVEDPPTLPIEMYALNPRLVRRSTRAKGAWQYPRPVMTRNFAMLEAKRLLNMMDYALLQGAANFLIVARKGSDKLPAQEPELENLQEIVRHASRTGVIIGDHRLTIDIITPDLDELLNDEKRKLIGRKLAMGLLRLPDITEADASGSSSMASTVEVLTRVITKDRLDVTDHLELEIYEEVAERNESLTKGPAGIWFPRIVLQGLQFFTDMILKLRDRGDISRRSVVESAGFEYKAEVESRKREKAAGDDRVLTPPPVPFTAQGQGPNDNGGGRPRGSGPDNGAPGAQQRSPAGSPRPSQVLQRTAGETVRAMWDEEQGSYRMGDLTYAMLEQYDERALGRITPMEHEALEQLLGGEQQARVGPLTVIGCNEEHGLDRFRAVRLSPGLSLLVGYRADDAVMTRGLVFREPEFSELDAQERAIRWGFVADAEGRKGDEEPAVD